MTNTVIDTRDYRLESIDFLRGVVMVIMALDHVRDFVSGVPINPADLTRADSALFLTRWVTHFCAPIFVFLTGVSAGLMLERRSKSDVCKFLLSRGLWLIFIEMVVLSFAWHFTFTGFAFVLQVIFVIGVSMLVLAALIWLPRSAIVTFSIIVVAGHNALDTILPATDFSRPTPLWHMLHAQGFTRDTGIPSLMLYPIIPWVGIMPLGLLIAPFYSLPAEERQKKLITIGATAIALFVVLRALNLYGDPTPWSEQKNMLFTVWSFINTQKYPPSLLFLLMTLGPGLVLLAIAEHFKGQLTSMMVTFGRVPFFFYVIHLYFVHVITLIVAEAQGLGWQAGAIPVWRFPQEYGLPLWGSWLMWIAVVAALYPPCKWFAGVKAKRKDWWLSYL